jgi:hypothetical protein
MERIRDQSVLADRRAGSERRIEIWTTIETLGGYPPERTETFLPPTEATKPSLTIFAIGHEVIAIPEERQSSDRGSTEDQKQKGAAAKKRSNMLNLESEDMGLKRALNKEVYDWKRHLKRKRRRRSSSQQKGKPGSGSGYRWITATTSSRILSTAKSGRSSLTER